MQNKNKINTDIQGAVAKLHAGELVAFPTETVYGLGADAKNPIAIQKVFQAKGRPADHPVIVHIATIQHLSLWAQNISDTAWTLAEHFWPGPLTLILFKQTGVSSLITGGQDTIGLRIPNHALTLNLLEQFGSGIVGPSANKYGRVSPTSAAHVAMDLDTDVAAILDGGDCTVGIESTIVDVTSEHPVIMRTGAISAADIAKVLGREVPVHTHTQTKIRTSGSHASHYAPVTPAQLVHTNDLLNTVLAYAQQQKNCSVLSFQSKPLELPANIYWQQINTNPVDYAHALYSNLRAHDSLKKNAIVIEQPPINEAWAAILDRLTRACTTTENLCCEVS